MHLGTLFERTPQGMLEIRHRSRTLTQTERQVLIWVNGKTNVGELCSLSTVIKSERIQRALKKLQDNGFIYEVLMPSAPQSVDSEPSAEEVENYLRKEDLDPVSTMMTADLQESLDDFFQRSPATAPSPAPTTETQPNTPHTGPSVAASRTTFSADKEPCLEEASTIVDKSRQDAYIDAQIAASLQALRQNVAQNKLAQVSSPHLGAHLSRASQDFQSSPSTGVFHYLWKKLIGLLGLGHHSTHG